MRKMSSFNITAAVVWWWVVWFERGNVYKLYFISEAIFIL